MAPLEPDLEVRIDRLVDLCGADTESAVAVAGPAAGPAMALLWRHGFARVEAARRVTCPSADQLSDILLIPGCNSVEQACDVVSAVLPILREGGRLAIDASRMGGSAERLRLCRMLANRGLRYKEGVHIENEILARKPDHLDVFSIAS